MSTPQSILPPHYRQGGFTLIELLIVIGIIGILAAIGVPQYGNYLDRSERSACMSELSSFRTLAMANATIGDSSSSSAGTGEIPLSRELDNFEFQSCATEGGNAVNKTTLNTQFVRTNGNEGITVESANRRQPVSINERGQISAGNTTVENNQ